MDFAVLANHRIELNENEITDKYLNLAKELKKTMEHEDDGDTYCNWCTRKILKGLVKGLENLEIRGQIETIQTTAMIKSAMIKEVTKK